MFCVLELRISKLWIGLMAAMLFFVGAPTTTLGEAHNGAAPATVAPNSAPTHSLWQRIVIVGASASAGFMLSEPFGGTNTRTLRLERYLEAALRVPHEPVANLASALFFMQPEAQGRMQVERALKSEPTLVVAPDFLFWFCYGPGADDEERRKRFESGLNLLESIPCRVVIGDIPDCAAAANGILDPAQIPGTNALRAANARLHQWAASRTHVSVAHISAFMRTAMANQLLTIHDQTVPAGKSRALLQADCVHPTPLGTAILALMLLDVAQPVASGGSAHEIRWNYQEVLRLGLNRQPLDLRSAMNASPPATSAITENQSESSTP